MKLCDMHTHSDNSFDAKSTVDELCQAALDKGLYAIGVTDHCVWEKTVNSAALTGRFRSRYGILIPQKKNTGTDCSF